MSKDINKVTLIGRLTRDPEISYTKSNMAVAKFSIANNGYKDDIVNFFNITVWDKLAVVCGQYLKKGSQVAISGELKQDRYQNKDGQNVSSVGITANDIQFLGGKSQAENKSNAGNMKHDDFTKQGFEEVDFNPDEVDPDQPF